MNQKMIRIDELKEGDLIDLEGDKFADPNRRRLEFQCEYACVDYVCREDESCVAIGIQGVDVFGFSPEHLVPAAE